MIAISAWVSVPLIVVAVFVVVTLSVWRWTVFVSAINFSHEDGPGP